MVEFDDLLQQAGGFGRVQALLYILLGIVAIPSGMQNLAMVFLGASMDHWCDVPTLSHLNPEKVREIAAVVNEDGSYSSCEFYNLAYSQYSNETLLHWNRTIMTGNMTVAPCQSWIFDRSEYKSSVRSQWSLVCSKSYIVALMQTVYMCGFLLGTVVFGIASDRVGRLKTMMLCCLFMIIFASLAAVISVYWHFAAFMLTRFFVAMCTAGFFTTTFVLIMEIITPKWRTHTGLFYQGFFAIGFIILPGVAYALKDLLYIQLAIILPTACMLSYYWIVPESPRWLIQKGRFEEAENILRKIAKYNKCPLPVDFCIKPESRESAEKLGACAADPEQQQGTLLDVLKRKRMRMRTFISAYCWFVCGMTYYGLSYSAEELGGSMFLNTVISGVVEYPAYIVCFFVVGHPRVGRKYSLAGSFAIGGISLLICVPLLGKPEYHIPLLVMANIGKLGLSASFAIVYIFTAEIFPTVVRSASVGVSSMCARIGALLTPQIMLLSKFWYGSAYIIFGAMAVNGAILALMLPESVDQVLPETMEDGELFGTKAYTAKHKLLKQQRAAREGGAEMTLLE